MLNLMRKVISMAINNPNLIMKRDLAGLDLASLFLSDCISRIG